MPQDIPVYQDVQRYEQALARHSQKTRWLRGTLCPCLDPSTSQPKLGCPLCRGRGRLYSYVTSASVIGEQIKHNSYGALTPMKANVVSVERVVDRAGTELTVDSFTDTEIQLTSPFPLKVDRVYANYTFTMQRSATDEDSDVVGVSTLRVVAPRFYYQNKHFSGSVTAVTKIYNVTKEENYIVSTFARDYIYLVSMGTWEVGDTLEVSYTYVPPLEFLIVGISMKMRYDLPYVLDNGQLSMTVPYYYWISPGDLITLLTSQQISDMIIDPTLTANNDVIAKVYDVAKLLQVVGEDGTRYAIGTDLQLFGRDEIKWLVSKPTQQYVVEFLYHPTFATLLDQVGMRNAENKSFVKRVQLINFDRTDTKVNI